MTAELCSLTWITHAVIVSMSTLDALTMNYVIAASILLRLAFVSADCNTVPVIANTNNNAEGTGPFTSGTVIKFECNLGYNPAGTSKEYQCSGNTWINGNLRCEQIYCRYIDPPEHGRVVFQPTNTVGSSINFECSEGYDMHGSNVMSCLTDGTWSPKQPPTCQIRMCGEFGSIQHGTTFQDSSIFVRDGYGSTVQIHCNSGYIINGSPSVMCQSNGKWGVSPTCLESTCLPYPGLKSSCILQARLAGTILLMMCKSSTIDISVTKTGPDSVECYEGLWEESNEIMACYCDCKINADLKLVSLKNVNESGFLKHAHTLNWNCKSGANKQSTQPLVCADGKIDTPTCISQIPITEENGSTGNPPHTTIKLPSTSTPVELIVIPIVLVLLAACGITAFYFWKKNVRQENKARNKNSTTVGPGAEHEKVTLTMDRNGGGNADNKNVVIKMGLGNDGDAEKKEAAPTTGADSDGNTDNKKMAITVDVDGDRDA